MTAPFDRSGQTCWRDTGVYGNGACPELAILGHCRHCPVYSAAGRRLLDRKIPDGFLEERTALLARKKAEVKRGEHFSVLVFRLQLEHLALRTLFFQEVAERSPVHSIPLRVNPVFLGLVNVHGELLPCASAAALLGMTGPQEDAAERKIFRRFLVVARKGERFVLPVDEILGVVTVAQEDLEESPSTITKASRPLTSALFTREGKKVGLLAEEAFFASLNRSLTAR